MGVRDEQAARVLWVDRRRDVRVVGHAGRDVDRRLPRNRIGRRRTDGRTGGAGHVIDRADREGLGLGARLVVDDVGRVRQ